MDIPVLTAEKVLEMERKDVEDQKREKVEERRNVQIERNFIKTQGEVQRLKAKESVKLDSKFMKESEDVEKRRLALMISKYLERFPGVSERIPRLSAKASVPEMEETLAQIRDVLNTQRSLSAISSYIDYLFMVIDNVWGDGKEMTFLPEKLRLNLKGISLLNRKGVFKDDLEPIINEIDIEYPYLGRQPLPMRILGTLSQTLLKVHIINENPQLKKIMGLEQAPPVELKEDEVKGL